MSPRKNRETAARHNPPSQARHPWRATFRTMIAAAIGLLPILALVLEEAHESFGNSVPWLLAASTTAGIFTRAMSTPQAEEWLAKYVPCLAAEEYDNFGPPGRHAKVDD